MPREWTRSPAARWAILLAGSFALFLALALLIAAAARRWAGAAAPLPLDGVPLLRLGAAYLAGGGASGALLRGLLPRARRREEAVCVGFLASLPFLVAIRVAVEGVAGWDAADVLRLAVLALGIGSLTGRSLWRDGSPPAGGLPRAGCRG